MPTTCPHCHAPVSCSTNGLLLWCVPRNGAWPCGYIAMKNDDGIWELRSDMQ